MGLAAFNRMRKVQEEAKKVDELSKPIEEAKEEIVVAEIVEQPEINEQPIEEAKEESTTRRRTRRNQE